MPSPAFIAVTSAACDGNINTMRYAALRRGMKFFAVDVPHEDSEEAVRYVASQLYDMIGQLEQVTGKRLDMDELSETVRRENESKRLMRSFTRESVKRWYPNTLTALMALLYPTHLSIGSESALRLFQILAEDIKKYPEKEMNRIMWIQLTSILSGDSEKVFQICPIRTISMCMTFLWIIWRRWMRAGRWKPSPAR